MLGQLGFALHTILGIKNGCRKKNRKLTGCGEVRSGFHRYWKKFLDGLDIG